jgi:hypothetical protein
MSKDLLIQSINQGGKDGAVVLTLYRKLIGRQYTTTLTANTPIPIKKHKQDTLFIADDVDADFLDLVFVHNVAVCGFNPKCQATS